MQLILLKRSAGIEEVSRQLYSVRFKLSKKIGPDSCRVEAAVHIAGVVGRIPHKPEDLVHLDDFAFHPGDLADAGQSSFAVRRRLDLKNDGKGETFLTAISS